LLDELSTFLDEDVHLVDRFTRIIAGWRAAVPDCTAVSIILNADDQDDALVLAGQSDDGSAGRVVSSLLVPLGRFGTTDAELRLDLSSARAFDHVLAALGPLLALDGRAARTDDGDRTDRARAAPPMLAAQAQRNQAVGVLLHRHGGSVAAARIRLDALASTAGRTVADIAAELVAATRRADADEPSAAGS
jgi:hypothetical protein